MADFSVNSGFLYLLAGLIIACVLGQSAFFLYKASKQARALGISAHTIRQTVFSSALFSLVPALSFLIGVISLSNFLGLPLPWVRLSVIGAITYELPAAEATARAIGANTATLITDPRAYTTIAWVMTVGILSGMLVIMLGLRRIQQGLISLKGRDEKWGEIFISALFLGMISAFVGLLFSDIRSGLPGWLPIAVALCSAAIMVILGLLIKKRNWRWLEQYALPISMLGGMALSLPLSRIMR